MAKTEEIIVPSNPKDRADIREVIKSISKSMTLIDGAKEQIKEDVKALVEKYGNSTKYYNNMAKDYHKQSFDQNSDERDDYESLYESIMKEDESD